MNSESWMKMLQLAGAVLAVPVAAGGAYSAYRTYFSSEVACQALRGSIVATLEKTMAPDIKRALLRKDVGEFAAKCGDADPDAHALFQSAVAEGPQRAALATLEPAPAPVPPVARPVTAPSAAAPSRAALPPAQPATGGAPTRTAAMPAPTPAAPPGPVPAAAPAAEQRGWVAIARLPTSRPGHVSFDGFAIAENSLPPVGTILTARWPIPVWNAPQGLPPNDLKNAVGRMRIGGCVRVVSTRKGPDRLWAEVVPARCAS
jgi:hypothetical protein